MPFEELSPQSASGIWSHAGTTGLKVTTAAITLTALSKEQRVPCDTPTHLRHWIPTVSWPDRDRARVQNRRQAHNARPVSLSELGCLHFQSQTCHLSLCCANQYDMANHGPVPAITESVPSSCALAGAALSIQGSDSFCSAATQ